MELTEEQQAFLNEFQELCDRYDGDVEPLHMRKIAVVTTNPLTYGDWREDE